MPCDRAHSSVVGEFIDMIARDLNGKLQTRSNG